MHATSSDQGSSEDIFAISEELVQSREHKVASTATVDFDGVLQTPLILHEDLTNGCGGQLWPAGVRLAKYLLLKKREELKHCSIVELGAGGGLVGLAVAAGCALQHPVHITDQDGMLELMRKNIMLNALDERVQASVYDWGSSIPEDVPNRPNVILAADCVYFEPAFPLLQQTLRDQIGERTVCYFCFKKRRRADLNFMKVVKKEFQVDEVLDDPNGESYARENVFLYTIRRRTTMDGRAA